MQFQDMLTKEFLEEKLINEKLSQTELARKIGCCKHTIFKACKKNNLTLQRRNYQAKKLVGQRFNKLLVIERARNDKFGKSMWVCLCDCGNKTIVNSGSLLRNLTTSCGCNKIKYLHHKHYEDIPYYFFRKLENGAIDRGIEFNITIEDIWVQYIKQNKKCAISGLDIFFASSGDKDIERTTSVDRIDSSIGYVKDNIQIVHKRVNIIKGNMTKEELLFWIKTIYNNNKNYVDNISNDICKLKPILNRER
jgi:hypothetical protein